jgi:hypothetical protein
VVVAPGDVAERARQYAEEIGGEAPRVVEREPLRVRPAEAGTDDGRENPLPGRLVGGKAIHVGPHYGTACIVARDPSGEPVLVSNHHVLTPHEGTQAPTDAFELSEYGEQGVHLRGEPVARTVGWQQFTTAHDEWPNRIDAAIARPVPTWKGEVEVGEIGGFGSVDGLGEVEPGDEVIRTGARKGTREGVVEFVNYTTRITYEWGDQAREITLKDCVQVQPDGSQLFSSPGDSGSPVFKEEDGELELVGVHFGGGRTADGDPDGTGIFCRIQPVFDAFDLRL